MLLTMTECTSSETSTKSQIISSSGGTLKVDDVRMCVKGLSWDAIAIAHCENYAGFITLGVCAYKTATIAMVLSNALI